jgi:hypothetical protein
MEKKPNSEHTSRVACTSSPDVARLRPDQIRAALVHTNPFCDAHERDAVIGAVHAATGGSDSGLSLAEEWYRRRDDFPGAEHLAATWRARPQYVSHIEGNAALRRRVEAYGFDWAEICAKCEPAHERVQARAENSTTPLDRYSLTSRREEVERTAVEQNHVVGRLALAGQLTAMFGPPGIGKSLITTALVGEACADGRIDPTKCYYLDFDNGAHGLLQRIDFAQAHGFNVLADGYLDMSPRRFRDELDDLCQCNEAFGAFIVLDTIKQHISLMDKERTSAFVSRLRMFSKVGGTCVVLAHVNKNPGPDGKPIYAGTTDLVEQVDAAYILSEIGVDPATRTRTVLFENFKSRGDIARRAAYRYSIAEGLSYRELLESVVEVGETQAAEVQRAAQARDDAAIVDVIAGCITEGVVSKMEIIAAASQRSGAPRRAVRTVLERYTGTDPAAHRWTYSVLARGEKRYALLGAAAARG